MEETIPIPFDEVQEVKPMEKKLMTSEEKHAEWMRNFNSVRSDEDILEQEKEARAFFNSLPDHELLKYFERGEYQLAVNTGNEIELKKKRRAPNTYISMPWMVPSNQAALRIIRQIIRKRNLSSPYPKPIK